MFRVPVGSARILVALAISTGGCGLLPKRTPPPTAGTKPPPPSTAPPLVGTVTLVNSDQGFVLLDLGSRPAPAARSLLRAYTETEPSAELEVSLARRHPFLIADIRTGYPRKGDRVYLVVGDPAVPRALGLSE